MRAIECLICIVVGWTAATIAVGACVDLPMTTAAPPELQLVARWDVRQCRMPHRIAIDLTDDAGDRVSHAAPCATGTMTLQVPELGIYHGHISSWELGSAVGSGEQVDAVEVDVDASVTRWDIARVP
jgi:hypothetical protein